MTRIGVEMPEDLLRRLERQAELTGIPRQSLIVSAVTGLVRNFEEIDAELEAANACPECGGATEVDIIAGEQRRACVRCTWSKPEPQGSATG